MANAVVVQAPVKRLILDLTQYEAELLKAVMQNPLFDGKESPELAAIREVIFTALQSAGVP